MQVSVAHHPPNTAVLTLRGSLDIDTAPALKANLNRLVERPAPQVIVDLSGLDYYRAFSWWKMACLLEGVAARLRAGAGGGAGASSGVDHVYARVDAMLERAVEAAKKI